MDIVSYSFICIRQSIFRSVGIVREPYSTYRSITHQGHWGELVPIAFVGVLYMGLASLIRAPEFHLYVLTREFVLLALGASIGYMAVVSAIYTTGRLLGGKGTIKSVALCWGYSLIATSIWFLLTSISFLLFPPPRTGTFRGISFSFVYLVVSSVLFFWKIELYYLTLRFSMRLDLQRIIAASMVLFPLFVVFAYCMYRLGIYRVPFL